MDWTDNYCRKTASDFAELLINEIIREIHLKKLTIHTAYDLTLKELGMIYRWPLYIGVNTFMERLIRTFDDKNRGVVTHYDAGTSDTEYYTSIVVACSHYYNGISLNSKLLNTLSSVISNVSGLECRTVNLLASSYDTNTSNKRQHTFKSGIRFTKRAIISFYLSFMRMFVKPDFIYEDSKNLNLIFPVRNRFQELPYKKLSVSSQTRGKLKEIFLKVYLNNQDDNLVKEDNEKNKIIAKLFSEWIDHVLPLSIVEGLSYRLNYYQNLLSGWDVKQIHISIGYAYNDNLKCFSILAKRKNAMLIGQDHGVNNFVSVNRENGDNVQYKIHIIIHFCDYYLPWGSNEITQGEAWNNCENVDHIKIINNGSVYLSNLTKWKKPTVNKKDIVLFYVSGPLRIFSASLQEVTPEKNIFNRKKVCLMLKRLLDQNHNLTIIYKSFMGIGIDHDPITKMLSIHINQGRVRVTDIPPVKLLPKVDIAFFDMISTGFAEAIQIGVPTLVFSNRFDYEMASEEGKRINDELEKSGMIFYDEEAGIKSFDGLVNNLNSLQEASKDPILQFQEAIAYPVSAEEFRSKLKKFLVIQNDV